jgi:hypothetical protein
MPVLPPLHISWCSPQAAAIARDTSIIPMKHHAEWLPRVQEDVHGYLLRGHQAQHHGLNRLALLQPLKRVALQLRSAVDVRYLCDVDAPPRACAAMHTIA